MLEQIPDNLPSMLSYFTFASKNSMYNTPPCFAIYTVQLVLKWLEETIGGLDDIDATNRKKAACLYDILDAGTFYKGTAEKDSRSLMNVTFRLPSEAQEKLFIEKAQSNGIGGLKGHRSVGGMRSSIYNAMSVDGVKALCEFLKEFQEKNQ